MLPTATKTVRTFFTTFPRRVIHQISGPWNFLQKRTGRSSGAVPLKSMTGLRKRIDVHQNWTMPSTKGTVAGLKVLPRVFRGRTTILKKEPRAHFRGALDR
jgi:hypothetical protein